jgi:hypothetical protein
VTSFGPAEPGEAVPQLVRRGEAQVAELVAGHDPARAGGALGDQQGPDRFYVADLGLRSAAGATRQRSPSRLDRVEGVGFAGPSSLLAVGAIDLDHLDPGGPQMSRQPGAICTRSFDPDATELTEALQPRVQRRVAGTFSRERLHAQHTAVRVERSRDMHVQVRIHSARDGARHLYDGHRHPFLLVMVKGWHARPGKETVTSRLLVQPARSPSGTGRAALYRTAIDVPKCKCSTSHPTRSRRT